MRHSKDGSTLLVQAGNRTYDIFDMNLSRDFQIDPHEAWVIKHNQEVQEVWDAYKADRPIRVPVKFTGGRGIYLSENNIDQRAYYENPDEMVRLQLEWQRRARELPISDTVLGQAPDVWKVGVDFHPVAFASSCGCPVLFRPDAVPAHECIHLSRDQCNAMAKPDWFKSGLLSRQRVFTEEFDQICENGLTFLGGPVERMKPNTPSIGGGVFSSALDVRGPEIMSDMYEDPAFARRFLEQIAEWQDDMFRAWCSRDGLDYRMENPSSKKAAIFDHGIDMLSVELFDAFLVPLYERQLRDSDTQSSMMFHHCGRGTHLFPFIKKRFGLTEIDALTHPYNDKGG